MTRILNIDHISVYSCITDSKVIILMQTKNVKGTIELLLLLFPAVWPSLSNSICKIDCSDLNLMNKIL